MKGNNMRMRIYTIVLVSIFILGACSFDIINEKIIIPDTTSTVDVDNMIQKMGDVRVLASFDYTETNYSQLIVASNSPDAHINSNVITDDVKEGRGALAINYSFAAKSVSPEPECVSIKETWSDFRPDLSFSPLGLSLWIKGNNQNIGTLRVTLIQDDQMNSGIQTERQYFQYINKQVIKQDGWQNLLIPYDSFILYKGISTQDKLNLSHVIGYRIDILNEEDEEGQGKILIDEFKQITSYTHQYTKKGKFNSIFLQLMLEDKDRSVENWKEQMIKYQSIGINTFIIQYSVGYGWQNNVSWYQNSTVNWNATQTKYDLIDKMVEAAESLGFKIIIGLNGGEYDNQQLSNESMYNVLLERNKIVINDLAKSFGDKQCFAGWYITEEFHDAKSSTGGWLAEKPRQLLAKYLSNVASYAKSKVDKPVFIAPALWRGMPAKMCGEWFSALLKDTHDIDYMYLQDLGGRGLVDVRIDLPNYYQHIKKACEEAGVKFGVDVETFLETNYPPVPYRAKTWKEIEEQLAVASQYTDYITNFSWTTFKPGDDSFEGYKIYYNSLK